MKYALQQSVSLIYAERTGTIISQPSPSTYVVNTEDNYTWTVGEDELAPMAEEGAEATPTAARGDQPSDTNRHLAPSPPVGESPRRGLDSTEMQRDLQVEDISIFVGEPSQDYRVVGQLKAKVGAATAFSKTPTVEDVNLKIRERAARLGANAVINVKYSRGVSATSWKALTAVGTAVVVAPLPAPSPTSSASPSADPIERIGQLAGMLASGAITADEYATAKVKLLNEL